MKNGMFKKILSLTLVVLMLLTAVFATGCGKKDKDKDKDEITLEDIKEKAKDAGYEVEYEKLDEADEDGIVAYLEIYDDMNSVDAAEFENTDAAKEAYEEAKARFEEIGEALGYDIKISGKIVIVGSTEIINKVW